jgi:hypothetical protein
MTSETFPWFFFFVFISYDEILLVNRLVLKLEDNPFSAARNCRPQKQTHMNKISTHYDEKKGRRVYTDQARHQFLNSQVT